MIACGLVCPSWVEGAAIFGRLDAASGAISISATGISGSATVAPTGTTAGLGATFVNTADLSFAAPALANFVSFQAAPTLHVNTTGISAGIFSSASCGSPPAVGQTCSLSGPLAGLNFTNTHSGVTASLVVEATLVDGSGVSSPMTGLYTFQFPATTFQAVLAAITSGSSVASSYSAEFGTTGGVPARFATSGSLSLSSAGIDFSPTAQIGATTPGRFQVANSSSGSFSPLSLTQGVLSNLLYAAAPLDTAVSIPNFLSFLAEPTLSAELTLLSSGIYSSAQCGQALAIGQTCTVGTLPFMFANLNGGSVASFDIGGSFHSGVDVAAFLGLFSFQFAGLSYQQVLAQIFAGQSVAALYSASFTSGTAGTSTGTVPEPASLLLLATGLAGITLGRRVGARRS
jgi:hypothetical protein